MPRLAELPHDLPLPEPVAQGLLVAAGAAGVALTRNGCLANGEIGIVVGHRRTATRNWFPDALEIGFSTQVGRVFKFRGSDLDEDGDANLELAYALTEHEAQGSEFGVVFLVLPRSPQMLTRELL